MICPMPPPIHTANKAFQNLSSGTQSPSRVAACTPSCMPQLVVGRTSCQDAVCCSQDAHPKTKPAPMMRRIPGRNNEMFAVYMSRKQVHPTQLLRCWKNRRMSPKTAKPYNKIAARYSEHSLITRQLDTAGEPGAHLD